MRLKFVYNEIKSFTSDQSHPINKPFIFGIQGQKYPVDLPNEEIILQVEICIIAYESIAITFICN